MRWPLHAGQHVLPDDLRPYDTFFFAFFYTAITFNPDEVADNISVGFPGTITPGQYLHYVINRITSAEDSSTW